MSISDFLLRVNYYILNPIILLLFALAFLYFVYGVIRFLSKEYADKERIEARNAILWGLIGMFIMFSVYAIIGFVLKELGITLSASPEARGFLNLGN